MRKLVAAPVVLTLASTPATAQMGMDQISQWQLSSNIIASGQAAFHPILQNTAREIRSDTLQAKSVQAANADYRSLDFRPNRRRRAQNLASFVQKSRASDPNGATELEKLLASTDIIDAIGTEMESVGLNGNNVADAYALWWMLAWHATKGSKADPSFSTAAAVRNQAAAAISSTPEFVNGDDAARQNLAEALLLQAALVDAMNQKFSGDPKLRVQLAKAVNQGAQKMGLDLTAMELTEEGFVMREGASAADVPAVPGEESEALAAAGVADDGGEGLKTYVLPALGGAAALAAVFLLGRSAGRRG